MVPKLVMTLTIVATVVAPPRAVASGHGPVFGGATPTLGKAAGRSIRRGWDVWVKATMGTIRCCAA